MRLTRPSFPTLLRAEVLREIELTDQEVEDILGHMFVDVTNDPLEATPEHTLPVGCSITK